MNKGFQENEIKTLNRTLVTNLKYKKDEKNCYLRKRRNW